MNKHELILIVDSDEAYARELSQYARVSGGFFDSAYACDGEEGFRLLTLLRPDVVILDAVMPVLDGMGFLRRLSALRIEKKPVVIMSARAQLASIIETASGYGMDYFMLKPQPHNCVCETAHDLLSDTVPTQDAPQGNELERSVTMYLRGLGMPAHLDGYRYMRFAIMKTIAQPELISPITKRLYPMIAEKFRTSKCCVERAIRHAISVSWDRGSRKLLSDIFGYTSEDSRYRPTNAEYIAMTADDFRMKFKYNML